MFQSKALTEFSDNIFAVIHVTFLIKLFFQCFSADNYEKHNSTLTHSLYPHAPIGGQIKQNAKENCLRTDCSCPNKPPPAPVSILSETCLYSTFQHSLKSFNNLQFITLFL